VGNGPRDAPETARQFASLEGYPFTPPWWSSLVRAAVGGIQGVPWQSVGARLRAVEPYGSKLAPMVRDILAG
jgi:hypothetical protein